jgi:membrane-associated phospholipid phosphatase
MEQESIQFKTPTMDKIATLISYIFHPLLVVIPTLIIAMVRTGSPFWSAVFWTLLSILIVNLPMAFLLFYGVRSGRYSDASVSIREQRKSIYLVGGVCLVILLVVLILFDAPAIITACLVSAVIATVAGFFVNRYTKLSLHSAAMAGCVTVLLWTYPLLGILGAFFMPLVAWARIHLKHHTPAQILIGWILAMTPVLIVFRLMLN